MSRTIGSVPEGRTCTQSVPSTRAAVHRDRPPLASWKRAGSRVHGSQVRCPAVPCLHDPVPGLPGRPTRDTAATDRPSRCKISATPTGASRPMCSGGQDHTTVPFTADDRPLVPNRASDVRLPTRRGRTGRHASGRHLRPRDWWKGWRRRPADRRTGGPAAQRTIENRAHRERQGVVLADRPSPLIHQRQSVHVGIHRHADRPHRSRAPAGRARPGSRGVARAPGEIGRRSPG